MQTPPLATRHAKVHMRDQILRQFLYNRMRKRSNAHALRRGHRLAVFANDEIGLNIYLDGTYTEYEIEDVRCLMETLGFDCSMISVLDIGANIGNHTVAYAKYFRHVYAFEPNPDAFELLQYNLKVIPNATAIQIGLSDTDQYLRLSTDLTNVGASSLSRTEHPDSAVEIHVGRLDDFEVPFECVKFIKIDVEGMESAVLEGARDFIRINRPVVAFEQLEREFRRDGETRSIELLRSLGYGIAIVQASRERRPWIMRRLGNLVELFRGRTESRQISLTDPVPPRTYGSLIAVPNELILGCTPLRIADTQACESM
jgi:FkbM family methyltransferase